MHNMPDIIYGNWKPISNTKPIYPNPGKVYKRSFDIWRYRYIFDDSIIYCIVINAFERYSFMKLFEKKIYFQQQWKPIWKINDPLYDLSILEGEIDIPMWIVYTFIDASLLFNANENFLLTWTNAIQFTLKENSNWKNLKQWHCMSYFLFSFSRALLQTSPTSIKL